MTRIDEIDSEFEFLVPGIIVLSEADFAAAFESAKLCGEHDAACWAPVDAGMAEEAAIIGGIANNPDTVAIIARLRKDTIPVPFSGSLFAILADPAIDDVAGLVFSRSFRLAAIQLTGTSSWVGTDTRL